MIKKTVLFLFIVLMLIIQFDNTRASTLELEMQDKSQIDSQELVGNLNLKMFFDEPKKTSFDYFDVAENGNIAVCRTADNLVCIYSATGDFLYGYSFTCYGHFVARFREDCIDIYFVRGDYLVSIDASGNVLKVATILDSNNNYSIISDLLRVTHIDIGEFSYYLKNDMGLLNWIANDWSQIVVLDRETGNEKILYDANQSQIINTTSGMVIFSSLFFISVFGTVKEFKKRSKINCLEKATVPIVDRD